MNSTVKDNQSDSLKADQAEASQTETTNVDIFWPWRNEKVLSDILIEIKGLRRDQETDRVLLNSISESLTLVQSKVESKPEKPESKEESELLNSIAEGVSTLLSRHTKAERSQRKRDRKLTAKGPDQVTEPEIQEDQPEPTSTEPRFQSRWGLIPTSGGCLPPPKKLYDPGKTKKL